VRRALNESFAGDDGGYPERPESDPNNPVVDAVEGDDLGSAYSEEEGARDPIGGCSRGALLP
jgi:hypothetical protein